jgi:hypothetical protein
VKRRYVSYRWRKSQFPFQGSCVWERVFFEAPNRIGPAYPNKISTSQRPTPMIHSLFDSSTLWL